MQAPHGALAANMEHVLAQAKREAQDLKKIDAKNARARMLLLPDSLFLFIWHVWIIGPLIICYCLYVPLEVSFAPDTGSVMPAVSFGLDQLFWLDIIINFSVRAGILPG